ncbi:PaaI family thioesterase [Gorillibacterium timonense]|uniref:PaaI family thioesterase n=1 Tax=Gorillibacterium timonense TaxID=1689269 RepID=UPI001F428130|nr:PaaI family thioesterase [Gorillibacterium timonense]
MGWEQTFARMDACKVRWKDDLPDRQEETHEKRVIEVERKELIEKIEGLSERDVHVVEETVRALAGMKTNRYPFLGNFLQIEREERGADGVFRCGMPIRPDMQNPYRIVYGGLTATLADMAMAWMLEDYIQDPDKYVTLDMNVTYHNPGIGKRLLAEARVVHHAADIWQVACTIQNDRGQLVATATGTFLQLVRKARMKAGEGSL